MQVINASIGEIQEEETTEQQRRRLTRQLHDTTKAMQLIVFIDQTDQADVADAYWAISRLWRRIYRELIALDGKQ